MATRTEMITAFIPTSPLVGLLGIELESIEPDRAVLRLPYKPELATLSNVVHGGAIAALADTAAMAAAWADDVEPEHFRGSTASLTVDYVAPGIGDLHAVGRSVRRGKRLCTCAVDVFAGETLVATALATYAF